MALRCTRHDWVFDIATCDSTNPAGHKLKPLSVRVREGHIYVEVPMD